MTIIDGASVGGWIKSSLGGELGAVTGHVPEGFEAYARVFHPASSPEGRRVRWAEVADACGTTPHATMQWHAILGLVDADELVGSYSPYPHNSAAWTGSDPPTGAMDIDTLRALCAILTLYTADPTNCFFGLSTIRGWLNSFPPDQLQPLLRLPYGRDYIILSGPLSAVDTVAYRWSDRGSLHFTLVKNNANATPPQEQAPETPLWYEAPSLIWPADRTWFVATDADFDSTLVGGSSTLVAAIVKAPGLEAWALRPTDSLAADADELNTRSLGS